MSATVSFLYNLKQFKMKFDVTFNKWEAPQEMSSTIFSNIQTELYLTNLYNQYANFHQFVPNVSKSVTLVNEYICNDVQTWAQCLNLPFLFFAYVWVQLWAFCTI